MESSFHNRTKAVVPNQPSKPTTYWVGVLKTDKKPEGEKIEDDYLWIKCHARVTIRTIREQYKGRNFPDEAITLKYGSKVPADTTVMGELNGHRDQVVALEAIKASQLTERMNVVRPPLQPSNQQNPAPSHPAWVRNSVQHLPRDAKWKVYVPPHTAVNPPSRPQKPSRKITAEDSLPSLSFRSARGSPQQDENHGPAARSIHSAGPRASNPLSTVEAQTTSNSRSASPVVRGAMRATADARNTSPLVHGKPGSADPSVLGPPASSTDIYQSPTPKPGDPACVYYVAEQRNQFKQTWPGKSDGLIDSLLMDAWLVSPPHVRARYEAKATAAKTVAAVPAGVWTPTTTTQTPIAPSIPGPSLPFKREYTPPALGSSDHPSLTSISEHGTPNGEARNEWAYTSIESEQQPQTQFQIQSLLADCTPEQLELSVEKGVELLEGMKRPIIDKIPQSADAAQWVQQIETLQKQAAKTKTIVGVVGNTGAGKSSVINAMLDEERLVPTNCMRACTAVVTEISYNHEECPYRAEIEFITVADWEKELETLFQDLLDGSGNVSRDCVNEDTDAGIAYAKIKAVYPKKTNEDIAKSSIEKLLQEVSYILGSCKKIEENDSLKYYKRLQHFVDSKEKSTGDKEKDNKKREKREMEFWPLIRVVRIYVKSPALATGAVIVDLPGVHDSNAARAAVAEGYMKQCTGLWIVAPINRAVDDKAAKSLLGESFKRQLKMDGGFSSVTFICSKTDDISLMEAQDSLGLDEEMEASWEAMSRYTKDQRRLKKDLEEMKESKTVYGEVMADVDEQLETWELLRDDLEAGNTVFAPRPKINKKRKNAKGSSKQRKKQRRSSEASSEDDDHSSYEDDASSTEDEQEDADEHPRGDPLNEEHITSKIAELRNTKKDARKQRTEIEGKMTAVRAEIEEASKAEKRIEAEMAALCISGRNAYSKGAIQQDFAAGIKELDQELAAEEDEENFNPDVETRDYEEVARSLPVFCVSSRGYQKLQGRLQKDPFVPGFKSIEETEIPQLQAHCKKLTEAGRAANCKRFLNNFSQLLNSLTMWASSDGTGLHLTADEKAKEVRFLQGSLKKLESGLEKVVQTACKELKEEFGDNIYAKYDTAVTNATNEAGTTASKWGSPVNREHRAAGGLCWSTYKAICRRNGIYSNALGPHEWNVQLADPMMRVLASGWDKTFSRRSPAVMASFSSNTGSILRDFHRDVDTRARKVGSGLAGLHMLQQQIRVYDDVFKDLSNTMRDTINAQQKEVNREFTPVIERAMAEAYKQCVDESGSGSFMRMKGHMNTHVEDERHSMFERSTEEVRERLTSMVRSVEETMLNKADEVFMQIRRDYLAVLGGTEAPQGEFMPKWQRTMRQEVMEIISGCEKIFKKIVGIKDEDEDREDHEEDMPHDDVKEQDEDTGTKVEQDVKIKPENGDENRAASGLGGTPEVDNSDVPPHEESHEAQDEVKLEKEDEKHDNAVPEPRASPEVGSSTLEHRNESHITQDAAMADSPTTELPTPPTPSTASLPTLEAANEVSAPTEPTDPTTAVEFETPPSAVSEEPTTAPSPTLQPSLPSLPATDPAPSIRTDDFNVQDESGPPEHQEPLPSSDLANQQLQNEIRGLSHDVMSVDDQADKASAVAALGEQLRGSVGDDLEL